MKRFLAVSILLSGCMSSPVSDEALILPPDPPPTQQVVVRGPPKPADAPPLSPQEIIAASEKARAHAAGYVAWKNSKTENIDRLTTLTSSLNLAIAQMQVGQARGKYAPADIAAARVALKNLRSFLSNKGD